MIHIFIFCISWLVYWFSVTVIIFNKDESIRACSIFLLSISVAVMVLAMGNLMGVL